MKQRLAKVGKTRSSLRKNSSSATKRRGKNDDEQFEKSKEGSGALMVRGSWGKWKNAWFDVQGDVLLMYSKRKVTKPSKKITLSISILKSADDLIGQEFSFALFVPREDPFYLRCRNEDEKVEWMALLGKKCASTHWSTTSMVSAFIDPVVVASQETKILDANDAFLDLFGYSRQDVMGKSVKILMHKERADNHDTYVDNFLRTGIKKLIGKPRSVKAKHSDGSDLHIILSLGVEIDEKDDSKTFIATIRRDKKRREQASKVEMEQLFGQTIDAALTSASNLMKKELGEKVEGLMVRLEEFKAAAKLNAAKNLRHKDAGTSMTDDEDDSSMNSTTVTQRGRNVMDVCLDNIRVGKRLGVGGSGCVIYACQVDGWECAMKELKVESVEKQEVDSFAAEIFLLESLPPHKNLVRYLFHQRGEEKIRVFMTRYESTLDKWLFKRGEKSNHLPVDDVAKFSLDVVRALEILHDYKIIHRDVKSQNLFVNFDMAGNVSHLTLADFDAAKIVDNTNAPKTVIGTVGWMPPEVYNHSGKSYTFSADIWSFACVWFELMNLTRPFADIDEFERPAYISEGKLPILTNSQAQGLDQKYKDLFPCWKRCMALEPEERPALREIKMELSQYL